MVTYGRLETKENFKLLALRVVVVAYKRFQIIMVMGDLKTWSLRRDGRLREVIVSGSSTLFLLFLSFCNRQLGSIE